jgi:UDP-glucose 4-epimerase
VRAEPPPDYRAAFSEQVIGRKVPYATVPRREGDPPNLVGASDKPRNRLGWNPRIADLRTIVEHAWKFAAKGPAVL